MPVSVSVEDPNGVVEYVNVLSESNDAVVLMVGLNKKRAEILNCCGTLLMLEGDAVLKAWEPQLGELGDLPIGFAEVSRYTCFWTIARSQAGRTVYTQEPKPCS